MNKTIETPEDFTSWKRKMQRELKKEGVALTYTKYNNTLTIIAPNSVGKNVVLVSVLFSIMPKIVLDVKEISKKALDSCIRNVLWCLSETIKYLNGHGIMRYKIEIKKEMYYSTTMHSEFTLAIQDATQTVSCDDIGRTFVDGQTYELLAPLIKMKKETDELYLSDEGTVKVKLEQYPNQLKFEFLGVIDRTINIKVLEIEKEYQVHFYSKLHNKTLLLKEISLSLIEEEYQSFQMEERLNELFQGPVMNEKILKFLKKYKEGTTISEETLFEFLLTQNISTSEMTEKSISRFENPLIRKNETSRRERELDNRNNDYQTIYYRTFVYTIYDRFLMVGQKEIFEGYNWVKKNDLYLLASLEAAFQKEKEWLIENL